MLDYGRLNELARGFANALFGEFPSWRQFATVTNENHLAGGDISVEVPQEGSTRVLQLSTTAKEITIRFDEWHTHIGPFLGIDMEESVETAMHIIKSFISEQTVVQIAYRDGKWIGSSLSPRVAQTKLEPNCTNRIFSWRGTFDREIQTA